MKLLLAVLQINQSGSAVKTKAAVYFDDLIPSFVISPSLYYHNVTSSSPLVLVLFFVCTFGCCHRQWHHYSAISLRGRRVHRGRSPALEGAEEEGGGGFCVLRAEVDSRPMWTKLRDVMRVRVKPASSQWHFRAIRRKAPQAAGQAADR